MSNEVKTYHNSSSTFVPAAPQRQHSTTTIVPIEVAHLLPPAAHSGHARMDDSAITHAKATLLVASAYIAAAGMITVGLLLIVWIFRGLGDEWGTYTFTGLIVWGLCILAALLGNRKQSLWHSPTGIAHHELDSRERIARHAIDVHAHLLITKWGIDSHE